MKEIVSANNAIEILLMKHRDGDLISLLSEIDNLAVRYGDRCIRHALTMTLQVQAIRLNGAEFISRTGE